LPKLSPVLNRAGQDVGDGFDAAMWMPGKSGRVIVEVIVTEIVQQEKWIEFPGLAEADGACQLSLYLRMDCSRYLRMVSKCNKGGAFAQQTKRFRSPRVVLESVNLDGPWRLGSQPLGRPIST
jgi:hypothetical protein